MTSRRPAVETGLRQHGDDNDGDNGERTPLLADDSDTSGGLGFGKSAGGGWGGWRGGRGESPDGKRRAPAPALRALRPPSSSPPREASSCCGRAMDTLGLGKLRRRLEKYSQHNDDLNIYNIQSVAIVMSYFSVGVTLELLYTPIAYYLIDDLGAEGGVYTVWVTLVTLPWSFKVAYGFLSDCVPIRGLKRKPYMLIGWAVHIVSNSILALMGTPGQDWVVVLSFTSACGYLLSDVMTDAIVVERTQRESVSNMGNIQASGYIARYFGAALGAAGGAILYNKDTWGWGLSISTLFWINGLVPLVLVLPLMPYLHEDKKPVETGVFERHADELWTLVQKRAVWRPMIFVYIYNALMLPNGAWTNYLVETLNFSDWDVGVVNIASQVFAWLGLIVYKQWLTDWNWPSLYFITTALTFIFSIMQLLLILGISTSWGIPDLVFASGDEAASEVVLGFQFLPLTRMYAVMCPTGSEGTSYALLTTVSNVAYAVAYAIGDLLTDLGGVWSTSNATLEAGDMSGMWRVTVLTSCVAVSPICLVWLLPKNKKEQLELQKSSESNSLGGAVFLWVTGLSILFTVVEAVWELIYDT